MDVNRLKHNKTISIDVILPENKTEAFLSDLSEELKIKLKAFCQRDYEMFYYD